MNESDVWGYVVYGTGALVVAVVGVVVLGLFIDAGNRLRERLFPVVVPLIGLAIATSSLMSGRNLSDGAVWAQAAPAGAGLSSWLLRFLTLSVLSVCAAQIVTSLIRRDVRGIGGTALFVAFVTFFVTNVVLNAALGTRPAFVHNLYYPLIVIAAAYTYRASGIEPILHWAKVTLLALLVLSCVAAVLRPELALERNYRGWIPGLNVRLWGVGSSANSIGPLALLYLLLAVYRPFPRPWLRWSGNAAAVVVLVLAQSKTAFAAAILSVGLLLVFRGWPRLREIRARGRVPAVLVGGYAAAAVMFATALALVAVVDLSALWQRFITSREGAQFLTLTGRDVIWAIALTEWERNPLFGYGPTMWDLEFRRSIGLSFAFSAHNQFLQSMGGAGTVGLVGLATYLVAMSVAAFRAAHSSRGLSLALLLLVVIRCMTEAPLTTNTLFNGDFLTHLLLFVVIAGHARRTMRGSRRTAGSGAASGGSAPLPARVGA